MHWRHVEVKAGRRNWIGFWATRDNDDGSIDVVFAWRGTMVRFEAPPCVKCKGVVHRQMTPELAMRALYMVNRYFMMLILRSWRLQLGHEWTSNLLYMLAPWPSTMDEKPHSAARRSWASYAPLLACTPRVHMGFQQVELSYDFN